MASRLWCTVLPFGFAIVVVLWLARFAHAAPPEVSAEVFDSAVSVGQGTQVIVRVTQTANRDATKATPEVRSVELDFGLASVLQGTLDDARERTSAPGETFGAGTSTVIRTARFTIAPLEPGPLNGKAVAYDSHRRPLASAAISIQVTPGHIETIPSSATLLPFRVSEESSDQAPWVGEAVYRSLELIHRRERVLAFQVAAEGTGYKTEAARKPKTRGSTEGVGPTERRVVVESRWFVPKRAGELDLPGVYVLDTPRAPAAGGLWPEPRIFYLKPRPIVARPLPGEERPANFPSKNVGTLRFGTEPVRLSAELGTHFVMEVDAVVSAWEPAWQGVDWPSHSTLVPVHRDQTSIRRGDEDLTYRATFKRQVDPIEPGLVELGTLSIPYFDTSRGVYDVAKSPPVIVEIVDPFATLVTAADESAGLTTPEAPTPPPVRIGVVLVLCATCAAAVGVIALVRRRIRLRG